MIYLYSGSELISRALGDDPTSDADAWAKLMNKQRQAKLTRVETLSAAHRLISSLADQTQSRSELEECRDVMAKLERMVEEG